MNEKLKTNDHLVSKHRYADTHSSEHKLKASNDRSRIAILNGWILAMIGIAAYCVAMLDDTNTTNPYASIFERGLWGWAAVVFLITGVLLWLKGALVFLKDVEHSAPTENPMSPDAVQQDTSYYKNTSGEEEKQGEREKA